ncbi:hypothetical protein QJS66_12885 [Kocuria rhizophila]|nr:hypothetical protein QJS66_12885 [Kocuria rhizophila]
MPMRCGAAQDEHGSRAERASRDDSAQDDAASTRPRERPEVEPVRRSHIVEERAGAGARLRPRTAGGRAVPHARDVPGA